MNYNKNNKKKKKKNFIKKKKSASYTNCKNLQLVPYKPNPLITNIQNSQQNINKSILLPMKSLTIKSYNSPLIPYRKNDIIIPVTDIEIYQEKKLSSYTKKNFNDLEHEYDILDLDINSINDMVFSKLCFNL